MNSLARSLIEKAGYDNGWEIVVESTPDQIVLASALHRAQAHITPAESGVWQVKLPPGLLASELTRETGQSASTERFTASNDHELGNLLNRAAKLARALPDAPEVRYHREVERELSKTETLHTEVERTVRQRVGQDIFRQSLMDYWGGRCAVTGIDLPELLRASHIKPWSECASDSERLNVFNGLLLAAHLDALFDTGLMTFDQNGAAIFSHRIDATIRQHLSLSPNLQIRRLTTEHLTFLRWHWEKYGY